MKVQIPDDNKHQLHMTHQEISGSFVLTLVPSPSLCTTERCLVYLSLLIASAPRSRAYVSSAADETGAVCTIVSAPRATHILITFTELGGAEESEGRLSDPLNSGGVR